MCMYMRQPYTRAGMIIAVAGLAGIRRAAGVRYGRGQRAESGPYLGAAARFRYGTVAAGRVRPESVLQGSGVHWAADVPVRSLEAGHDRSWTGEAAGRVVQDGSWGPLADQSAMEAVVAGHKPPDRGGGRVDVDPGAVPARPEPTDGAGACEVG